MHARAFCGRPLLGLCAIAVLTAGDPARTADEDPAPPSASELVRRGDRLARDRKYVEALEAWAEGYRQRVPQQRGLEFRHPVPIAYMGREELRDYLLTDLAREQPDEEFRQDELVLAHFGLCAPGTDLKKTMVDLLTSEVAGFYDPAKGGLFIARHPDPKRKPKTSILGRLLSKSDDFDPDQEKAVLAHEMAHSLADQHFDLYSMQKSVEHDDDMSLAYTALVEGEAMMVMILDMSGGQSEAQREAFFAGASGAMGPMMELLISLGTTFAGSSAFHKAPLYLREGLLFPYTKGFTLCGVLAAQTHSWATIDSAFRNPPVSSEQILHPEKYAGSTPDVPWELSFKTPVPLDPERWKLIDSNCLGEFMIEILLRPQLGGLRSSQAAAGWDGDRYAVYRASSAESPSTLLVWVSTWDSGADATQFAESLIANYATGGESPADLAAANPDALRLWRSPRGVSGVWLDGEDVVLVDRVPESELGKLRELGAWAGATDRKIKTLNHQKHERPASDVPARSEPPAQK